MPTVALQIERHTETLNPDDRRVITRYMNFADAKRIRSITRRLERLDATTVDLIWASVIEKFTSRHRDIVGVFASHYRTVARYLREASSLSEHHRGLIGAYFTCEYSFESAALFNPSMVPHPDQSGLAAGEVRVLISLRATGEGHLSSIVFRRGIIDNNGKLNFDPPPRYAYSARPEAGTRIDRNEFFRELIDADVYRELAQPILDILPDPFTLEDLVGAIDEHQRQRSTPRAFRRVAKEMLWHARTEYELRFPEDCRPSEIVIFPATKSESHGMEDLRLVRFSDDEGGVHYYGTYTAFDGTRITPMLLQTSDFHNFWVSTFRGKYARNKGMALFPKRIHGWYMMVGRHDGESLYLLRSENLRDWDDGEKLYEPTEPWELTQIGNCGSPIETDDGWLLLTHGVGPVREYSIGAMLLDRMNPARILGRLREPLLVPTAEEREGYVPNVVYSCGALIHRDRLIIPYATSDSSTRFASILAPDLIKRLKDEGP